ncbi:MAG TPA: hypothetical protein VFG23_19050 [Polyangia bacterium]|nr:hypothetical protein [Polyangia bacterium]
MKDAEGKSNEDAGDDAKSVAKGRPKRAQKGRRARLPKEAELRAKSGGASDYPRHAVRKALRIPQAILDQNAGKPCTEPESAKYAGVGYHGPYRVELSSSIKYGFLSRPSPGSVELTELAKKVLRPQTQADELEGLRQAVLNAPKLSDVYKHYRGENIPDEPFFGNTLLDTFSIPKEKQEEFKTIFFESLDDAKLIESQGTKRRVLDVSTGAGIDANTAGTLKRLEKAANVEAGDACFVMMPFAEPIGGYYKTIYEPAIKRAGLRAVRADDDMFSTGKIVDQIWSGINAAKVLVAELTGRNPNVFYELGLAHALQKPVVLVSSNEKDVPFDVQHIRVIYYNVLDPFWGEKLIAKISENILSALQNPAEAILRRP